MKTFGEYVTSGPERSRRASASSSSSGAEHRSATALMILYEHTSIAPERIRRTGNTDEEERCDSCS